MKAVGIILATSSNQALAPLTDKRATSSIPVAGGYRAVDFSISNMSNSGIKKIAIISQTNTNSIYDHLRSGKWWNIGRKKEGLYVLSPSYNNNGASFYRGSADALYQNITFLKKSFEEFVVVTHGDCIYKLDFNDVIKHHVKTNADVTIVTQRNKRKIDMTALTNVTIDSLGKISYLEPKPLDPVSDTYSTGIYVFRRKQLIEILTEMASNYRYSLTEDLFFRYRNHLNIQSYDLASYWNQLTTIDMYFQTNMDFLKEDVRHFMFRQYPPIYTKVKDLPPAKYNFDSVVKNSMVGRGSIIDGTVLNSVIFRDVKVGRNSTLKNCIVIGPTQIGDNCHLENVIIDKGSIVENDTNFVCKPNDIKVFEKGATIKA